MRREASGPALVDHQHRNVTDLLAHRVRTAPEHIAFGRRGAEGSVDVTTAAFDAECRALAAGLVAQGLEPGGRVAVMAPTRFEWALADLATWLAGGVVVPVYETSSPQQVAALVGSTAPTLAIAGGAAHRAALVAAAPTLPVWTMDAGPRDLAALAHTGRDVPAAVLEHRRRLAGPEDVATIVHTSGTAAEQKGARITHGNLVGVVEAVTQAYGEVVHDRALVFYPAFTCALVHLAVRPTEDRTLGVRLRDGALLGGIGYATWSLTGKAILERMTWPVALADIGWGLFVGAAMAGAAHLVLTSRWANRSSR